MAASVKINWLVVKRDFLYDETVSLEMLSNKFNINYSYLRYVASKEKWIQERKVIQQSANNQLTQKMPEAIAETKLKHARIGKVLQATGLEALNSGIKPRSFHEATIMISKGIDIEREALGMNEKQVKDEVYEKFSQFSFIFNFSQEELSNFIKAAFNRSSINSY